MTDSPLVPVQLPPVTAQAAAKPLAERLRRYAPLLWPTLMLGVCFLVPFGIMLVVSFFHRVQGGFYEPAFELSNYAHFLEPLFLNNLGFSLLVASLTALISISLGLPFTYVLTRMNRRVQIPIVILLLCVLTLSEVLIGFSWSVLLSRTAGVSNIFVWLGALDKPIAHFPSFGAVLTGLVYFTLPYAVFMMYPNVSRLDPRVVEAARTLGASPVRTFFTVVVPMLRPTILGSIILVFVFTLGAYLIPQMLGRPAHWTLSVLITDQAIYKSNIPFAAAMAIFLILVTLALIGLALIVNKPRRRAAT
jgi:putative spermidine/putrescine transport system permease protein